MSETFGKRLARLRAQAKLSQRELAAAAGITHPQISRYERGASVPRLQVVMALAKALKMESEDLLHGLVPPEEKIVRYTPESMRLRFSTPSSPVESSLNSTQMKKPINRTKLEVKVIDGSDSITFKSLEDSETLTRAIQGFLRDFVSEIYFDEPDLLEALRTYMVSEVKLSFAGDNNNDNDN
ncbi:helix-turn-helix domain-containing protein [Pseudomonas piscis]|uniref:helix-turn-helix domain-containing protein n=1 Tax=Pseudomonas piscis TaxID=2614538 RepID=UPI0039A6EAE8